ncbi:MAG: LytTR family DNA-binding domain-containing protein [Oscillospiraceae bacterium]|nr:LytTR family DNA-binding domain-containing protein [Oscillospiraceae bacterium]
MVRFAVCDDNLEMAYRISEKLCAYYPSECEINTYVDGESLLMNGGYDCFDAIFLDIGMPKINGMQIAKKIRESNRQVKIIFVTNKNELAYKGYIYDAFRFVRKSNLDQELCEAAESLNEVLSSHDEYLAFKTPTGEIIKSVKGIKYFEAMGHYINIVCIDGTIQICGTMREYEEQMKNNGFIRIHKSYLVNFRYIYSVTKNNVNLICGKKLPLSRLRIDDTKIKLMFFPGNLAP